MSFFLGLILGSLTAWRQLRATGRQENRKLEWKGQGEENIPLSLTLEMGGKRGKKRGKKRIEKRTSSSSAMTFHDVAATTRQ